VTLTHNRVKSRTRNKTRDEAIDSLMRPWERRGLKRKPYGIEHMARTLVEIVPIGRTGTEIYSLLLVSVQKPAKVKSI
jgi:hypothetical protein